MTFTASREAIVIGRETFYDAWRMSGTFPRVVRLLGALAALAALPSIHGCGDDHEDPAASVRAACNDSCSRTAGSCNLPGVTVQDCAILCDLGYNLAPACASTYQSYVACAKAAPLLACSGTSVSVDVAAPACLNQLGQYLTCAVGNIQACFELPLDDGACTQQNMGPHARACVGTPPNCTLLTGTVQAGGVGVFCCP